ncbi:MAG: TMEM165/GDT1 family protein, partial [Thermoplasmata archaeon]
VFLVVGGVELVDRTHFALIGFSARNPPLASWVGAAGAFLLTSGLAVLVGAILVDTLHGEFLYLRLGGAAFLIGYAIYLILVPESQRTPPAARSATAGAFLLIFLLELGDTTMILMILFVTEIGNPILVYAAGAAALCTVAAIGCTIGSQLGARIEPKLLDRIVPLLLIAVAVATIIFALNPGWVPTHL